MSATTRRRLFPSYSLDELKSWTGLNDAQASLVAEEIAAREANPDPNSKIKPLNNMNANQLKAAFRLPSPYRIAQRIEVGTTAPAGQASKAVEVVRMVSPTAGTSPVYILIEGKEAREISFSDFKLRVQRWIEGLSPKETQAAGPALKLFRAKAWDGVKSNQHSVIPFRKAAVNPDPELFEEVPDGDLPLSAKKLRVSGYVEFWGWL